MRKIYLALPGILLLAAGLAYSASGQLLGNKFYHISVGVQGGTTHYQGDLDDNAFDFFDEGSSAFRQRLIQPGLGLQLNFHFNPYMHWRLSYNQGWIQAADSLNTDFARNYRNLHFRSQINEFALQLVIEPFARNDYFPFRKRTGLYIFGGIGVFHFNPQADASELWKKPVSATFSLLGRKLDRPATAGHRRPADA